MAVQEHSLATYPDVVTCAREIDAELGDLLGRIEGDVWALERHAADAGPGSELKTSEQHIFWALNVARSLRMVGSALADLGRRIEEAAWEIAESPALPAMMVRRDESSPEGEEE